MVGTCFLIGIAVDDHQQRVVFTISSANRNTSETLLRNDAAAAEPTGSGGVLMDSGDAAWV
jgi:type 1 fimbria pilin